MKNIIEIEAAIKALPKNDFRKLAEWLNEYLDDDWDVQMQNDLAAGRLDALITKAESDIKAYRVKDLNEVINDN